MKLVGGWNEITINDVSFFPFLSLYFFFSLFIHPLVLILSFIYVVCVFLSFLFSIDTLPSFGITIGKFPLFHRVMVIDLGNVSSSVTRLNCTILPFSFDRQFLQIYFHFKEIKTNSAIFGYQISIFFFVYSLGISH